MRSTPLELKIAELAAPVIADLGLELFCVRIIGEGGSQNVQIMAEDPATGRLGIDECTKISKAVSAVLDVEDPISGAYRLEVSSPGIDRMLIRPKDFEKYTGFDVKIETDVPAENGQKRFRGLIKGIENNMVSVETDQELVTIDLDTVKKAKLVLTDDLIKKTAQL